MTASSRTGIGSGAVDIPLLQEISKNNPVLHIEFGEFGYEEGIILFSMELKDQDGNLIPGVRFIRGAFMLNPSGSLVGSNMKTLNDLSASFDSSHMGVEINDSNYNMFRFVDGVFSGNLSTSGVTIYLVMILPDGSTSVSPAMVF